MKDLAVDAGLRFPSTGHMPRPGERRKLRKPAGRAVWIYARWALGLVGVVSAALTTAQALAGADGVDLGGAHLHGESIAWSAAAGVAMIFAALRPSAASGLACVLAAYSVVLAAYVVGDAARGVVSLVGEITHLPMLAGALLALLVWRGRRAPSPPHGAAWRTTVDEVENPDQPTLARRVRRRPSGGTAA
jgi:predicted anti-sigma-YlaC factor YlaD